MSLLHAFGLLTRPKDRVGRDPRPALRRRRIRSFAHTAHLRADSRRRRLRTARPGPAGRSATGDVVRLTEASALRIAVLYYLAMVAATLLR